MKRRSIDEQFEFYDSARECADAAAPIFLANRWRWTRIGIPTSADIFNTLLGLQETAEREQTRYLSTGRLMYHEGRFAHERPRVGDARARTPLPATQSATQGESK